MTPEELEDCLAGRPDRATVEQAVAILRADPDWMVNELVIEGHLIALELFHRPTRAAYTLRSRPRRAPRPTPSDDQPAAEER